MLKVRGVLVDTICAVCLPLTSVERAEYLDHPMDDCFLRLAPWLRRVLGFVSQSPFVKSQNEAKTTATRVLFGDQSAVPEGDQDLYMTVYSAIVDSAAHVGSRQACLAASQRLFSGVHQTTGDAPFMDVASKTSTFNLIAEDYNQRRCIFRTSKGYMGLGTDHLRVGDEVALLYGHNPPFVLRRMSGGSFRFIGECYVDGIMGGEFMATKAPEEVFRLV
jgi:hypothetical protein